jgi:hypothetical protein
MKTIKVNIKNGGKVTVETSGFAGDECQKATESLERKLGAKTSDTPTDEALLPPLSGEDRMGIGNY